jgi:Ankyrin repeat
VRSRIDEGTEDIRTTRPSSRPCQGSSLALIAAADYSDYPVAERKWRANVTVRGRTSLDEASAALVVASADGAVLEIMHLLIQGADPDAVSAGGVRPLHRAGEKGRLEVCAMLLDAGADPTARTTQGSTASGLASNAGHPTVALFLGSVELSAARGYELSPGHSHLEMCRLAPGREQVGDRCPKCGLSAPGSFNDHVASHLWEDLVKTGRWRSMAQQQASADDPSEPIPAGKVVIFPGGGLDHLSELGVTAEHVIVKGLNGTETIPLDSIQSVSVSGLLNKCVNIYTSGRVRQWGSGYSPQKAEKIRQLIVDAREALMSRRSR